MHIKPILAVLTVLLLPLTLHAQFSTEQYTDATVGEAPPKPWKALGDSPVTIAEGNENQYLMVGPVTQESGAAAVRSLGKVESGKAYTLTFDWRSERPNVAAAIGGLAKWNHTQKFLSFRTKFGSSNFSYTDGEGEAKVPSDYKAGNWYRFTVKVTAGENDYSFVIEDLGESGSEEPAAFFDSASLSEAPKGKSANADIAVFVAEVWKGQGNTIHLDNIAFKQ